MKYPLEFRQKVFSVKEKYNLTFEAVSARFDIPIRTLFRWQQKIEPCLTRNKPVTKINMDALKKDIESSPDDYQWERAKRFNVSQSGIHSALKRLKVSHKKNLKHPKANENKRTEFQEKIKDYESKNHPIIYLDESGFEQSMPRMRAYSKIGERCYDTHNWQAKKLFG